MLLKNANNEYECAICHHSYGDVRGLSTQVCKQRKMDAKAYYDQYVKMAVDDKTEHDITFERGLFRIYDCGQYRYVWKRGEQGG